MFGNWKPYTLCHLLDKVIRNYNHFKKKLHQQATPKNSTETETSRDFLLKKYSNWYVFNSCSVHFLKTQSGWIVVQNYQTLKSYLGIINLVEASFWYSSSQT